MATPSGLGTRRLDGPADFAAHDVLGHLDRLRSIPVRVACGRSDPFLDTSRELARSLPAAQTQFPRGGHNISCWNTLRPGDVRFLGQHLAA